MSAPLGSSAGECRPLSPALRSKIEQALRTGAAMPDYCGPYQSRFVQTVNGPQPIAAFPVPSACNNLFTRSAEERGRHFPARQPGAQTQNSRRVKNALRGLWENFAFPEPKYPGNTRGILDFRGEISLYEKNVFLDPAF